MSGTPSAHACPRVPVSGSLPVTPCSVPVGPDSGENAAWHAPSIFSPSSEASAPPHLEVLASPTLVGVGPSDGGLEPPQAGPPSDPESADAEGDTDTTFLFLEVVQLLAEFAPTPVGSKKASSECLSSGEMTALGQRPLRSVTCVPRQSDLLAQTFSPLLSELRGGGPAVPDSSVPVPELPNTMPFGIFFSPDRKQLLFGQRASLLPSSSLPSGPLQIWNTELKGSASQTWSRSVYCHACHAYCQGFLPS